MSRGGERIEIQLFSRIEKWLIAHPEYAAQVLDWRDRFLADPLDPRLDAQVREDQNGQTVYEYIVDAHGALLNVVLCLAKSPDEDGITWARVLSAMSADELLGD